MPEAFRSLVIDAVTHGGLPANAAGAAAANPIAAANLGLVGRILDSAEGAFGHGLHTALIVTSVVLLVAAVIAFFTESSRICRGSRRGVIWATAQGCPSCPKSSRNVYGFVQKL